MRNSFAWAALALMAGAFQLGCGKTCGPSNCTDGCCDANNVCQLPAHDHCGKNGGSCAVCVTGQVCGSITATCEFGSGANGSGGNGSNTNGSGNGSTTSSTSTTGSSTTGTTSNTTSGTTGVSTTSNNNTTGPSSTSGTSNNTSTTGTSNTSTTGTTSTSNTSTTGTTSTTNTSTTGTTSTSNTSTTGTTTSSSTTTTTGTSSTTGANTYPAISPDWPTVPDNGQPGLSAMQVITISFGANGVSSYAHHDDISSFTDWIMTSSYWSTIGSDYGVGPGSHAGDIVINETAPGTGLSTTVDDTDIQTYLLNKLQTGALPLPGTTYNGRTLTQPLYTFFYPANITITLQGTQSCSGFGGYHSDIQYNGQDVSYAVMPLCGAVPQEGLSELQYLTIAAAHEYIEAATDPYPMDQNALGNTITDQYVPWYFIGGEVGDLCYTEIYTDPSGWTVQPIWSNSAAQASMTTGQDPCVPNSWNGQPYVNAVASPAQTTAGPASFQVTAFSSGPAAQWYLGVIQAGGTASPTWTLTTSDGQSINQSSSSPYVLVSNGTTATFTVSQMGSGAYAFYELINVTSQSTGAYAWWPVVVYD